MDWKTWYQEHLCPPQQAVRRIRSGDRVVVAHATGEPSLLLDAMVANAAQYEHVEIVHMVAMGKAEYCQPAYDRNFSWGPPAGPLPRKGGPTSPPSISPKFPPFSGTTSTPTWPSSRSRLRMSTATAA